MEEEPEKAREAIQEAVEELAKLQSRVEGNNAATYSRYFARISNLLSEAKTAFTAGNYEVAKKLAEKAEEALEDIEDAIERFEEKKEEREELQSENETREKVTPGAQSRNP